MSRDGEGRTRQARSGSEHLSEGERQDRQMLELLNELRVALPGVQILFAFLLTVPFTSRFAALTRFSATSTTDADLHRAVGGMLHRPDGGASLRFHQGNRKWLIESSNWLAIAGLVLLALSIGGAVLLITDLMFEGIRVWIYPGGVVATIVVLWFVRPLLRYARSRA